MEAINFLMWIFQIPDGNLKIRDVQQISDFKTQILFLKVHLRKFSMYNTVIQTEFIVEEYKTVTLQLLKNNVLSKLFYTKKNKKTFAIEDNFEILISNHTVSIEGDVLIKKRLQPILDFYKDLKFIKLQ